MRPLVWLCVLLVVVPTCADNLVRNPSFEELDEHGVPMGWQFDPGRAGGALALDTGRSGRRAIRITNPTALAPHVFCALRQTVDVEPDATYTLSAYVRGTPGRAWVGGGDGWKVRCPLPAGADWQRVSITFHTGPAETEWLLLILSEDRTDGFVVDDVQLEAGERATEFIMPEPLEPNALQLAVEPVEGAVNLLPNPSFEHITGGVPDGWRWDPRNTDATCQVVEGGHSGARCVKITNGTRFGAHVYGLLRIASDLEVKPGVDYTLSFYCRNDSPTGTLWVGGGQGWRIRVPVVDTGGVWRRVTRTFRTLEDETVIPVMILTESPTAGVYIDDVQLERGARATPFDAPDTDLPASLELAPRPPRPVTARGHTFLPLWKPDVYPPAQWTFCSRELPLEGTYRLPEALPNGRLEVALADGDTRLAEAAMTGELPRRAAISARYGLPTQAIEQLTLTVRLLDAGGRELQALSTPLRVVTPATVTALLDGVAARLPELEAAARDNDDVRVTATVVRHFIEWTRGDLARGITDRAYDAAVQLGRLTDQALTNPPRRQPAPRYVTSPLRIVGPGFFGRVRTPAGEVERPVYFTGYGHFGSVRRDIEVFPDYGHNLIQIEFGPNSVLPDEDSYSDDAITAFLAVCDRAAAAGVQVNLLLSPHYFPAWAYDKWPHLREFDGGFLRYSVYAPEARAVLEKSLRYVIPRIKDHPALHSLCLSNEPVSVDLTRCRYAAALWHEWLARRFGDIAAVNRRWGTAYPSLDAVPVPPPKFEASAMVYDFTIFNQEAFAAWHRWMADVIHELAPAVPVHAKIMMSAHFYPTLHGCWGVAPELFSDLSQINGNDCCKWPGASASWACDWVGENMGYDYQRSAADLPVFNSENHLIIDRTLSDVSPEFIRNVYWQGAIHGQGAETTWVWERTDDFDSDFTGSIMHRPECVEAHGRAGLDLNRAALEVYAIASQPAPVALLWSQASLVHRGTAYFQELRNAYVAANFLDVPVGFVNERDAERYAAAQPNRAFDAARVVVLAGTTHVPATTLMALERFVAAGGTVVRIGACLTHDETGRPASASLGVELPAAEAEELWAALREVAARAGVVSPAPVGVFGVEARAATLDGAVVLNLCNYRPTPQIVTLPAATDVLTGERLEGPLTLPSLEPRLVRIGG